MAPDGTRTLRTIETSIIPLRLPICTRDPPISRNISRHPAILLSREYFGTHGDVVVRDVESRIPMTVSILSETRTPYGMNGGEDVKRGLN